MKRNLFSIFCLSISALALSQSGNTGINTTTPNTTLTVEGGLEVAYKEVAAAVTLTKSDYNIAFTGATAATITLPTITSASAPNEFIGRIYRIKNLSAVDLTIAPASGQNIRTETATGATSIIAPSGYTVEIVNSGATTWNAEYLKGSINKSWLITYDLTNTNSDWISSFDTKIDSNKYSVSNRCSVEKSEWKLWINLD